jgi:alginate O-acetyltransferase complex protein AlgI
MVFSSVVFIFYFLPVFLAIYYLSGAKNAVLLTGSAFFYVWGEGVYVFLLIALLVLNRWAGIAIGAAQGRARFRYLAAAVVVNFAVLGVFKYSQFVVDIAASVGGFKAPHLGIHLPLGISFFIFQLASYVVEVYRRTIEPERSMVRLSTYVMMYPHLVAGPIVRYTEIQGELRSRTVTRDMAGLGIQYFIVGLCQKVLIANSVAPAADHLFGLAPSAISPGVAWIGTLGYTLQIYFDFCGYSNMAIGLAFMLGFRFPKNFDYPYASRSITEFWRRWHMSLSFWFRDYVYIPLGGSRQGRVATVRNLLIVFFVTGLWHGAAWTFVFWGVFHGAFVVLEHLYLGRVLARVPSVLARVYTLAVVMVGWVFFRADTFSHAWAVIRALGGAQATERVWDPVMTWMTPETIVALAVGCVLSFPVVPAVLERLRLPAVPGTHRPGQPVTQADRVFAMPSSVLLAGFVCSLFLLATSTLNPFLYFRF